MSNSFVCSDSGDATGILDLLDVSRIETGELARELARERGRELAGSRLYLVCTRDVRGRASSEWSDAAVDVGIFPPKRPLASRAWEAE